MVDGVRYGTMVIKLSVHGNEQNSVGSHGKEATSMNEKVILLANDQNDELLAHHC